MADILRSSPWCGFGAGGLARAYDSLWVETLAISGVLGAVMMALVLVVLACRWLHLRSVLGRPEWRLAGATLALAAGASLGLPSLTANRACTMLWLILGVLVSGQPGGPDNGPLPEPASSRLAGLQRAKCVMARLRRGRARRRVVMQVTGGPLEACDRR